jgi:hypothetical protein
LPDLTVPLATYAGWNLRHPEMGAPDQLMSLMGAMIPFPATRRDREALGDPRLSIIERYPNKTEFLAQVRRETERLVDYGHLLAEDVEFVVGQASQRYEILLGHVREPLAAGNKQEFRDVCSTALVRHRRGGLGLSSSIDIVVARRRSASR